ncbi:MAG: MBL fold metallo-hydrolase [Verrucomicrobiota bacterium]
MSPLRRFIGLLLSALPLLTVLPLLAAEDGKLTVTWLEMPVHGLAAVVETPSHKVFLVDTGGVKTGPNENYNAGRDTVTPFLRQRGYSEITGILISHPHGDHYGGLEWLLQNWTVKEMVDQGYEGRAQTLAYKRLRDLAMQRGGKYRAIVSGDHLDWDPQLSLEILSPPATFISADSDPKKVSDHGLLNSNSLLLRMQHGKIVFLFPGDAYGGAFESFLKENVPMEKLRTTVLTAPHHGFNPGYDFPKMLMPQYVVTSCLADYAGNAGTPNPRSPGDRAMEVYGKLGAEVFVTAFHGQVQAVSDGQKVTLTKTRERQPKTAP